MTNQEAKLILSAYRPGGQDALDPMFEKALDQARLDPEMTAWFRESLRFDAAMSTALTEAIPIPPDLSTRIRAGMQRSEPGRRWKRWGAQAFIATFLATTMAVRGEQTFHPGRDDAQVEAAVPRLASTAEMEESHEQSQ